MSRARSRDRSQQRHRCRRPRASSPRTGSRWSAPRGGPTASRRSPRRSVVARSSCDVTSADDVARLAEAVGDRLDVLVNNAGGALGLAPAADTDVARLARACSSPTSSAPCR